MEKREILLKLDDKTKQLVCHLLHQHAEELREKANDRKTFWRLVIAYEVERINNVLDQINAQWR